MMHRDIRFRIFDRTSNTMETISTGWSSEIDICSEIWKYIQTDSTVLMQYTGIFDIYDKPIFEGDIVNFFWYEQTDKAWRFQIVWDRIKCKFILTNPGDILFKNAELHAACRYEVLGNIYQNNNLLHVGVL